jgi:hypothetical protein
MIRLTFVAAIAAALLVPAVASAKGPTSASISGPGFSKKIKVLYDGSGGTPGGDLTQQAGFFPAAFGQQPDPMLHRRPGGKLGPRYTILWRVPGGAVFVVRQDIYPYARGGAVTYMKPGQPIFDMTTRGGWYRDPQLKRTLVGLGLSAHAPAPSRSGGSGPGSGPNWALIGGLLALAALVAAGVGLWWYQRGQRSPSTSSTEFPAGSRT